MTNSNLIPYLLTGKLNENSHRLKKIIWGMKLNEMIFSLTIVFLT